MQFRFENIQYIRSVYHINQFVIYEDGYVILCPCTSQSGTYIVGF
jgi:hypothetical protein